MASSLILNKRISTTVAKAKELRKFVEPLINKSKTDSTHSRRTVFAYLQNKESVKTLFDEVATKVATRPGGFTRIIRIGNRLGDNADMCIMELVDYNEIYTQEKGKAAGKKTRRSRRGSGKGSESIEASETKGSETKSAKADDKESKKSPSSDESKSEKGADKE